LVVNRMLGRGGDVKAMVGSVCLMVAGL